MRFFRNLTLAVTTVFLMPILVTAAGVFPDVSASDPNFIDINAMASMGIIKGYADGTFKSANPINRAEFATMIARALGVTPPAITVSTFVDVPSYEWYAPVIGYLSDPKIGVLTGYADGTMKPKNPVTFAEALAMTMRAFKIPVADTTADSLSVLKQINVSTSAWYTKYLATGYTNGMLPIRGQDTIHFNPDIYLTRGQTTGMVNAGYMQTKASSSSSSTTSSSSDSSSSGASASSSKSSYSAPSSVSKNVTVPFADSGSTKTATYMFSLTDKRTVLSISTVVTGYYPSTLSCRLYKLESNDTPNQLNSSANQNYVSYEYYLGVPSTGRCDLLPAVGPGKYQLEIHSTGDGAIYQTTVKKADGYGNDGFIDALPLQFNVARTAVLNPGDIYDAYQFTVTKGGNYLVELSGINTVDGVIYEPAGVTDDSFSGPVINKVYQFKPATYTLIVSHKYPLNEKAVYSVSVKSQ